jgi:hypothetical protein
MSETWFQKGVLTFMSGYKSFLSSDKVTWFGIYKKFFQNMEECIAVKV